MEDLVAGQTVERGKRIRSEQIVDGRRRVAVGSRYAQLRTVGLAKEAAFHRMRLERQRALDVVGGERHARDPGRRRRNPLHPFPANTRRPPRAVPRWRSGFPEWRSRGADGWRMRARWRAPLDG